MTKHHRTMVGMMSGHSNYYSG